MGLFAICFTWLLAAIDLCLVVILYSIIVYVIITLIVFGCGMIGCFGFIVCSFR